LRKLVDRSRRCHTRRYSSLAWRSLLTKNIVRSWSLILRKESGIIDQAAMS